MRNIDYSKAMYFLDKIADGTSGDEASEQIREFLAMEHIYLSATREIITKLENLNDEFKYSRHHNPIHQIMARVKTPRSIIDKLCRRGHKLSIASARQNLNDIAGVRVVCSYIDDIYLVAKSLILQDDIKLVRTIDYIENPKPNGYRSLHLIVTVPVFLSTGPEPVKVEVQIRTIAMDFWASLEHELAYRARDLKTDAVTRELKDCADVICDLDARMQRLYTIAESNGVSR